MTEQDKNELREIYANEYVQHRAVVNMLLDSLDERDREVERLTERKNQLRESRRFWREEHNKLLLENQRLKKALEEISDKYIPHCNSVNLIDCPYEMRDIARQAISGEEMEAKLYWQKCPSCGDLSTPECEGHRCHNCGQAKYVNDYVYL